MSARIYRMTKPDPLEERLERAVRKMRLSTLSEDPAVDQSSVARFGAAEEIRIEALARGEEIDLLESLRRLERGA